MGWDRQTDPMRRRMPCDQSQDHVMSYKEDSRPRATRQSRVLSASRVLSGQEESTHRKTLLDS